MGWRVSNDILYTLFNVKGQGPAGGNGAYYGDNAFNYHYLKTHHMLQINLLQKPVIYVSAGLSTGFILKDHFQVRVAYVDGRTAKRQFQSKKSEFGLLGGLGFRVKKWNAEVRYENSTGVSNFPNETSQTTRILFLIKYRLRD